MLSKPRLVQPRMIFLQSLWLQKLAMAARNLFCSLNLAGHMRRFFLAQLQRKLRFLKLLFVPYYSLLYPTQSCKNCKLKYTSYVQRHFSLTATSKHLLDHKHYNGYCCPQSQFIDAASNTLPPASINAFTGCAE